MAGYFQGGLTGINDPGTIVAFSDRHDHLFLTKTAGRSILPPDRLFAITILTMSRIKTVKNLSHRTGILPLCFLFLLLTPGCSNNKLIPQQRQNEAQAASLPEHIYRQPLHNTYANAQVGIFKFSAPPHLTDVGYNVANSLYQALGQYTIFHIVTPEFEPRSLDLAFQMETARARGYDLIITGMVDYYLDSTQYQESRVDVAITVYDVKTAAVIWQAIATTTSRPTTGRDYILYKTKVKRPLPAAALIEMNTVKFINMFLSAPSADQAGQEM